MSAATPDSESVIWVRPLGRSGTVWVGSADTLSVYPTHLRSDIVGSRLSGSSVGVVRWGRPSVVGRDRPLGSSVGVVGRYIPTELYLYPFKTNMDINFCISIISVSVFIFIK